MAISRILLGATLVLLMYAGPYACGAATAGGKVSPCLSRATNPQTVVVKLSYTPGPTQLEDLQRYGRYGGSGGNLRNVVLLDVPPQNVALLSQLYWIDRIEEETPC